MNPHILALITLYFALPLDVVTTAIVWKMWRRAPKLRVLRERFVVSACITNLTLFFGVIFINNDRVTPWVGLDTTKWVTRLAILLAAVVTALGWLVLYYGHERG